MSKIMITVVHKKNRPLFIFTVIFVLLEIIVVLDDTSYGVQA